MLILIDLVTISSCHFYSRAWGLSKNERKRIKQTTYDIWHPLKLLAYFRKLIWNSYVSLTLPWRIFLLYGKQLSNLQSK